MADAVGLVGLGVMGSAIAGRLLDVGVELVGYDVRDQARADLIARGASAARSPAELARRCGTVILSLNTADIVREVVLGPQGLGSGPASTSDRDPGVLVIDMSSIDPASTRAVAAESARAGIRWVDAPLSGGAPAAAAGSLTLMVGGRPEDVELARTVLQQLATRITHLGPVGTGQLVKLVNQVLVGAGFSALAEAAAMVRAEGLEPDRVLAALSGGRADSALLQEFFTKFATGDLTPTGRIANMVKDLDTASAHARSMGLALPVTSLVAELNRWLDGQGLGGEDNAALMGFCDRGLLPAATSEG